MVFEGCHHEVTPVERIEINVDDYLDLCIIRDGSF